METPELLKRRIESAEQFQSVVRTMKSLAAVNVRQYEKAVESLADYTKTVEMGLQVVLRAGPDGEVTARRAPRTYTTAIVIGSDLGMCGQLNEQIVSYALGNLENSGVDREYVTVLVIGARVSSLLEDQGLTIARDFEVPGSLSGITPLVQDLLLELEELQATRTLEQVQVYYSQHEPHSAFTPVLKTILPVDRAWLDEVEEREWPSRTIPTFSMNRSVLFSVLIREYLFAELYRAVAESLASENSARLVAMQGAEKNIADRIEELTARYHHERQTMITSELLEILAGFEALKEE